MYTKALSRFIQIFDASFPSGAFVHSFGLEAHIVLEEVQDIDDLKNYLNNVIVDQYQKLEFACIKRMFTLLKENKINLILKEDIKILSMLSYEYSKASKDMGKNYLKHINFDIKKPLVKKYYEEVQKNKNIGNELFILSAYAYEIDLSEDLFILLWCKKNLINIASCSLKISRIKPSEIQKLLFELDDKIEEYIKNTSKNIRNFNPLFEENIFKHKNLEPKMFVT